MTDIEHAKKYAEESISLAISMYNPKAESIAEIACLYGLTYKNEQIAELEQENKVLTQNLEDTEIINKALEKENAELRKTNTEVKKSIRYCNRVYNDNLDYSQHIEEQLTKAKEIIKELLSCCRNYPQENAEKVERAEQFLKEVEK